MAYIAENSSFSDSVPDPSYEVKALPQSERNIIAKAMYDVARSLGGIELAATISSWEAVSHKRALEMLESVQQNAREQVDARMRELRKIEDLKKIAYQQMSPMRKFGDALLRRMRNVF